MDIEVLGPLTVHLRGRLVLPTAPKPRKLLAMLALRADQVVPITVLIDELWGQNPPRSARTTMQTYVLQLRELIGEALELGGGDRGAAKDVLVTLPGGYRLETSGGSVDFREFDRRVAAGYRAFGAEDFHAAARLLRSALSLWTAPALADVQAGPYIRMEINRLEETRLGALDRRMEVDLRLGRHREVLSELTLLVNQHRTNESLHRQFMLALHRCGRPGEALSAYQRLRATLVEELGLEPSPQLQRLQRAIIASRGTQSPGRAVVEQPEAPARHG
ncbi:hypothetical protein AA958_30210 [Streptomyces sp. CNQ-509]|uniref:AfsR/SARP family transcriptional regulator n=1 Tax=Streptomyces sp. CNQ-509 TaxID=444103 RepID=UPI00062E0745|nr:AfsR/SARP family transcriptional regulator [Streptomyces sp. CNQ-509]AKH85784.1 hypothetical protein AA958_30210 [Streptomyces sp. CNQ-509]